MRFIKLKRVWFGLFIIALLILLASCSGTRTLMMTAPNKAGVKTASPPLNYDSLEAWETDRVAIKSRLETQIYGKIPQVTNTQVISQNTVTDSAYTNKAIVEETEISFVPQYRDHEIPLPTQAFRMVVVAPKDADGPVPIILTQNFCPNHNVVPVQGLSKPARETIDCGGDGVMSDFMHYFFGRYIVSPPFEDILNRGYAVAVVHPPAWVPDRTKTALSKLQSDLPQSYAIGAWATQFDAMAAALDQDERFSEKIAYGHSRYGKSALVAAAFSPRIDAVISHQSGTGGASLSKDKPGETVAQITKSYPHWFSPNYREDALTIDQHFLLALIAPKPMLLGNAKRDVWSDPQGAFQAARAATPIYNLYGFEGLKQTRLDEFQAVADIAFWMRPGTHGVVEEDWPAFLEFLDAHFK